MERQTNKQTDGWAKRRTSEQFPAIESRESMVVALQNDKRQKGRKGQTEKETAPSIYKRARVCNK